MSRKYKQRGYQEYDNEKSQKRPRDNDFARSQPQRVSVRVFKCSLCGNELKDTSTISHLTKCTKCQSDLHSCVNCTFFDPSSSFQCMKEIPRNISPKDKANNCALYQAKGSIEHRFVNLESHTDARKAFENLFKKS
ncbi:hypothetical protein JXQ70_02485 [bacterium]|nr:hypothetical protein [bacterium]